MNFGGGGVGGGGGGGGTQTFIFNIWEQIL